MGCSGFAGGRDEQAQWTGESATRRPGVQQVRAGRGRADDPDLFSYSLPRGNSPGDSPALMRASTVFPVLMNDSRQGLLLSASPAPLPKDHGSVPVTCITAFPSAVPSGLLRLEGMTEMGIYLWSQGVTSNPALCCVQQSVHLGGFRFMWSCCGFRKQTPKDPSLKLGVAGKASRCKMRCADCVLFGEVV